jgi:UDP-3-O-[3-hydroxymyristoyl] glucosamine N-acyltransferase
VTLSLSAGQVAEAVKGRLEGDPATVIKGAAGLEEAGDGELSFFHNVKYLESPRKPSAQRFPREKPGFGFPIRNGLMARF